MAIDRGQGIAQSALVAYSSVAASLTYSQGGTGAVTRTVENKLQESVSVKDFGATGDGVTDDYSAFTAALAASRYVLVPAGTYKIGTQIDITGDRTISGHEGGTESNQAAKIYFTAGSGNLFSATSAEYGGVCIQNLYIYGGNGGYAVRSSRPQSIFRNLYIGDAAEWDGGGIQLFQAGTGSQASWSTLIEDCKWVGKNEQTDYIGYDITINGGHCTLENCVAIRGTIGININQGEAINIYRCSLNLQTNTAAFPFSSEAADSQCGIRLSGSGYKQAVTIRQSYIEACTYGVYVEKCEGLTIAENYIADVGIGSNYAGIFLKGTDVGGACVSVNIQGNHIKSIGNLMSSIDIGDGVENCAIKDNYMTSAGTSSVGITKGAGTYSIMDNNYQTVNPYNGSAYVDPNYLLINRDYQTIGFDTYKLKDFTSVNDTWYTLGAVSSNQVWQITIMDSNTSGQWHVCKQLVIDKTGNETFETIYAVQEAYSTRELRVDSGNLQFRTTGAASDTGTTITAIKIA